MVCEPLLEVQYRPSGSCPPRIYGLPKIHKLQTPLRPIVSCTDAPSYKLSKYIASVISPLAWKTDSHVLNSKQFTGMVNEECVEAEEALVSFDVTSLFTNVPIDEAVDIIHRKLAEGIGGEDPTTGGEDCRAPPALSEINLLQPQW